MTTEDMCDDLDVMKEILRRGAKVSGLEWRVNSVQLRLMLMQKLEELKKGLPH